jgi:uncharacterized membrane protein YfcA
VEILAAYPVLLIVLGFLVGMVGTLVGAGGGFILVPVLLFLMPHETPGRITALSLGMVFFNALSGTAAYARMKRIDYSAGWRFALAALPGAYLGSWIAVHTDRLWFDRVFGIALAAIALYLLWRTRHPGVKTPGEGAHGEGFVLDARGLRIGCAVSAVVGVVSSLLGIGGGIVHVPALIYLLSYPVHMATATSHFVMACTSLVAVLDHVYHHSYDGNELKVAYLAVGAVVGAQIGARLSKYVRGKAIVISRRSGCCSRARAS